MKTFFIIIATIIFLPPILGMVKDLILNALEKVAPRIRKHFRILCDDTVGIVIGNDVHILSSSTSRYMLCTRFHRWQYCCQCGTCDRGLRENVIQVVRRAKALGATRVILRHKRVDTIEGLPISDVSNHVGQIDKHRKIVCWKY